MRQQLELVAFPFHGEAVPKGLKGHFPYPFCLEGFGAGPACPKGQLRLFVGDLTVQVRFAPLSGKFLKEIWT